MPLFKYVVKQFENRWNKKIDTNTIDECKRTAMNEEDPYYRDLRMRRIQVREHNYLKNTNLNQDILDIVKNDIKLPNAQCAGCC